MDANSVLFVFLFQGDLSADSGCGFRSYLALRLSTSYKFNIALHMGCTFSIIAGR